MSKQQNPTKSYPSKRIDAKFAELKKCNQAGFVAFLTAGDPDYHLSLDILKSLPEHGVDIIEIGMPFSDPMADGPVIQASSLRSLTNGHNLQKTLNMVEDFRKDNQTTPIILMGYYNPIYSFGVQKFLIQSTQVGVDGLIIVDLPPEEDNELCLPSQEFDLSFIRLVTPTSTQTRLNKILNHASGFLYYVSMTGITGSKAIDNNPVKQAVSSLRNTTTLPIAVGFGIKTPEQAAQTAQFADAVVIGSALVEIIATAKQNNESNVNIKTLVLNRVDMLSQAIHYARSSS